MYKVQKVGMIWDWIISGGAGIFAIVVAITSNDWQVLIVGLIAGLLCLAMAVRFFFVNREEERGLPAEEKEINEIREKLWGRKE